jgi:hypothetical protein
LSKLDALPANATLHLRDRPTQAEVEEISNWLEVRPESTLRVEPPACELLDGFGTLPFNLELDRGAVPPNGRSFDRVARVTFSGARYAGGWLECFPNAHVVRVDLHGETMDAAGVALERLTALSLVEGTVTNLAALDRALELRTLELRDVALDSFEPVGRLHALRSLRLCAVERVGSLAPMRGHRKLTDLWLERLPHLLSLRDLGALPALESLALIALWQFGMAEAETLYGIPTLRRASIDIGGRRKNVEISKRLCLPETGRFRLDER